LSSLNPYMKLRQNGTVSFSIKLAAFQASGWAERWIPGPDSTWRDVVMESNVYRICKQFRSHVLSRQGGLEPGTLYAFNCVAQGSRDTSKMTRH
ncbi:MAG: hypothetical protein ABF292_06615, partial [Desulfobacterales bacterium]